MLFKCMERNFAVRVKYRNQLLRGVAESPSLETFRTRVDTVLRTRWPCLSRGVGLDDLQRSLPPQPFCESVR